MKNLFLFLFLFCLFIGRSFAKSSACEIENVGVIDGEVFEIPQKMKNDLNQCPLGSVKLTETMLDNQYYLYFEKDFERLIQEGYVHFLIKDKEETMKKMTFHKEKDGLNHFEWIVAGKKERLSNSEYISIDFRVRDEYLNNVSNQEIKKLSQLPISNYRSEEPNVETTSETIGSNGHFDILSKYLVKTSYLLQTKKDEVIKDFSINYVKEFSANGDKKIPSKLPSKSIQDILSAFISNGLIDVCVQENDSTQSFLDDTSTPPQALNSPSTW